MTDIQEGDQVSWKFGQGTAEGVVAEVKTSGDVAIETKGKEVKVKASEDNPGVHIARDGNDVVKRANALHKDVAATEESNNEGAENLRQTPEAENGISKDIEEKSTANGASIETEHTNGHSNGHTNGHANGNADTNDENGDKMDTTPDENKVELGEKRPREDDEEENASEEEKSELENGKETKKAKIECENDTEPVNEGSHPDEKISEKQESHEAETTPKKKAGRPKKSEAEAHIDTETSETISGRTRSKA